MDIQYIAIIWELLVNVGTARTECVTSTRIADKKEDGLEMSKKDK